MFIKITPSDSDMYLTQHKTKEDLLESFSEDGDREFMDIGDKKFCNIMEERGTLIIKGNIVIPKPKTVVETYDID